jgi:hypothetical protein
MENTRAHTDMSITKEKRGITFRQRNLKTDRTQQQISNDSVLESMGESQINICPEL